MIWRIVILFFLISTSLSAQRIIPAKVPLSYSWALNANPMRDYLEVRLDETHFIQWEMPPPTHTQARDVPIPITMRRELLRAYCACVTSMDYQLGVVLDKLESKGLAEYESRNSN